MPCHAIIRSTSKLRQQAVALRCYEVPQMLSQASSMATLAFQPVHGTEAAGDPRYTDAAPIDEINRTPEDSNLLSRTRCTKSWNAGTLA